MIRINLLETREERRKLALQRLALVAVLVWLVTFVALWTWHGGLTEQIESAQQRNQQRQQEIERLNKIVGEVEEIKEKKADVEQKLGVIRDLEANRAEIVDLLLALAEILVEEVWFDELTINDNQISAKAMAIDMQSIGILVKKLKADDRFTGPSTSDIQVKSSGKGESGHVSFNLNVTFVPPQGGKDEES